MRFKRVGNETVKCHITQDELRENGLRLEDFLANNGKTEEFLRKMIEEATVQVGFKAHGGPMAVQVSVMPDSSLLFTFSERPISVLDFLENLKQALTSLGGMLPGDMNALSGIPGLPPMEAGAEKKTFLYPTENEYMLQFESMDCLLKFVKSLKPGIEAEYKFTSSLYKSDLYEDCYLFVNRGEMDDKLAARIVAAAVDFVYDVSIADSQNALVKEHARCIIGNNAITTLQEVNS